MKRRLFVGTRKGLFTLLNDGSGWRITGEDFVGDPVTMVLPDPRDGTLYVALKLGHFGVKLRRSSDEGRSWKEMAVPTYPEKPKDWAVPEGKNDVPWSLDQIWCLESGGNDREGVLWAGTLPGGLFRSDDRGETWELNQALWNRPERLDWFGGGYDHPGIHSICVDPEDSHRMLVGVSCGGAWRTEDAGGSWACRTDGMFAEYMPPDRREDPAIQDPHRIVQCRSAPKAFWTQHHNGVFRSVDGAESWGHVTDTGPSDFGFAVAVHPDDPDLAWLVPGVKDECRVPVDGHFVVTRTRDGGESWESLDGGLPARPAYELVFRHCLEIEPSGQDLAMGSTTGSLWTSSDHGDSWTPVTFHLPPIYCVRFG